MNLFGKQSNRHATFRFYKRAEKFQCNCIALVWHTFGSNFIHLLFIASPFIDLAKMRSHTKNSGIMPSILRIFDIVLWKTAVSVFSVCCVRYCPIAEHECTWYTEIALWGFRPDLLNSSLNKLSPFHLFHLVIRSMQSD